MAKWGEGDPRWIVEERPDATNVNNWHWTEKNACGWSKTKFKELFNDLKIENNVIKCKIIEVEKCEGEAVANNRKGKLIFFYEWDITLKWKGKLVSGEEKSVTGKINIPNLSEENEIHEVDVNVSVDDSSAESEAVKDIMRAFGSDIVREQLSKYVKGLKAEFSQGMILPSKDGCNDDSKSKDNINDLSSGLESKVQVNNSVRVAPAQSSPSVKGDGLKVNTITLETSQKFQCTGPDLYNALTRPEMVVAFTHGPVKLDVRKGGEFQLFGGNIFGEFIELIPNSKIIQTWRFKRWPQGHFSTVTIDILQRTDHTELKLKQTGVPSAEIESTKENWERYYWEAMKRTFGFGYFI